MSSGMSSNSGVERYRSPVSGSMQRIVDPLSAFFATSMAPARVAPADTPTNIPSSAARALLSRIASAPLTGTISSIISAVAASSVSFGIKSGLQPCMRWGRKKGWLSEGVPLGISFLRNAAAENLRIIRFAHDYFGVWAVLSSARGKRPLACRRCQIP